MISASTILYILLFAILAAVCIGIGVFVLLKTGESKNLLLVELDAEKKHSPESESPIAKQGLEARLEKNNQLISTFNKTEGIQNELKMVQIASEKTEEE